METINLQNYKIIYEFLKEKRKNYGDSRSGLGAGFSESKYDKMKQNEDLARHLFIRKMKEVIDAEKSKIELGHTHIDLDIDIDSESHLLTND